MRTRTSPACTSPARNLTARNWLARDWLARDWLARRWIGALAVAAAVVVACPPAQAFDESKYPDFAGQWKRPRGIANQWDITKPIGRAQQPPLTPEYQAVFELKGKLTAAGRQQGLLLSIGGYFKNVFTLAPSLYITYKEIDLAIDLFEEAFREGLKA